MENNRLESNWTQMKDKVRGKWNKLTDEDLKHINGKKEHLLNTLKSKYGWDTQRAEQEYRSWESSCKESCGQKECKDMNKKPQGDLHHNKEQYGQKGHKDHKEMGKKPQGDLHLNKDHRGEKEHKDMHKKPHTDQHHDKEQRRKAG